MIGKRIDADLGRAAHDLLCWAREANPELLADLVSTLGRLGSPLVASTLAPLAEHPDAEVRLAVAQALGELGGASPATVAALIALSRDEVDEVRSWATFSLSCDELANAPGVTDALAAKLDDSCEEVRVEAVRGLATRADARVLGAALDLAPEWARHPIFRQAIERLSLP